MQEKPRGLLLVVPLQFLLLCKKVSCYRGTVPLEIEDYDDSSCLPGVHVRGTPIYESGTCRQTMFLMFMLPAFSIRLPKAAATMHTFTTGINDCVNGQLCNTLKGLKFRALIR